MSVLDFERDECRWSHWMRLAQQGDEVAYAKLLTELGGVIEKYLMVRFGRLNDREDYVQECLLAIHAARHTYNPVRAFRPWMFTVARHRCIDLLRRGRPAGKEWQATELSCGASPDHEHMQRIIDGVRMLDDLQADHREAVMLTKYLGMTTAEAAAWLSITEHAVKARLRRGLQALGRRRELEEMGE